MKSYRFWWFVAIIFTVVCVAKTLVFGSTYITRTPSGLILEDTQYGTVYINKMPLETVIEDTQEGTTYINETPSGYVISGNGSGNVHPYINLNDDREASIGLYYGAYHEDSDE